MLTLVNAPKKLMLANAFTNVNKPDIVLLYLPWDSPFIC